MTNDLAVSMDELERESAELLPSRETLCVSNYQGSHGASYSFSQTGYGNTAQSGGINIAFGNGDLNNLFSGGSGNVW